jgi:hypothetical protein
MALLARRSLPYLSIYISYTQIRCKLKSAKNIGLLCLLCQYFAVSAFCVYIIRLSGYEAKIDKQDEIEALMKEVEEAIM